MKIPSYVMYGAIALAPHQNVVRCGASLIVL